MDDSSHFLCRTFGMWLLVSVEVLPHPALTLARVPGAITFVVIRQNRWKLRSRRSPII